MPPVIELERKANRQLGKCKTFVICDACFWCASFLVGDYDNACPECGKDVSSTTLGQNEGYRFDYSDQRSVELEFYVRR